MWAAAAPSEDGGGDGAGQGMAALQLCLLQQGGRSYTGPGGPGLLRLLCPVGYRLSVVEVGPSRGVAVLLSLVPVVLPDPIYRPRSGARGETALMTTKSWCACWRAEKRVVVLRSCLGVFVSWAREKSVLTRSTPTWCRLRVASFLVGGCRG